MNPLTILQIVSFVSSFLSTSNTLTGVTHPMTSIVSALVASYDPNPVKWLQKILNAAFNSGLAVDGHLGPKTEGAVLNALAGFVSSGDAAAIVTSIKALIIKV